MPAPSLSFTSQILTRQETTRWLMTTAATAHQRCFSQASKKTTPQNMWSRMMAMVMKAGKKEKALQTGIKHSGWWHHSFLKSQSVRAQEHSTSDVNSFWYLRTGSSAESLRGFPQYLAPPSQPRCSPLKTLHSWSQSRGRTLKHNKEERLLNTLLDSSVTRQNSKINAYTAMADMVR